MDSTSLHSAILIYAIVSAILGVLLLGLGFWARDRVDALLVDSVLGDRLDEEEHEFRANNLHRGVAAMFIVGTFLLFAAAGLALWAT